MSFKFKGGKNKFTLLDNFEKLQKEKKKEAAAGLLKQFNVLYENGENVLDVGITNEFGDPSRHIPARPFMRRTRITKREELNKLRRKLIKGLLQGKTTTDVVLALLGEFYADAIKYVIRHEKFADNSKLTIALKGPGKKPLFDTGLMIESIKYIVRPASKK